MYSNSIYLCMCPFHKHLIRCHSKVINVTLIFQELCGLVLSAVQPRGAEFQSGEFEVNHYDYFLQSVATCLHTGSVLLVMDLVGCLDL